jgi:drug/metabolite transporter (DMT)-like permease
MLLLLLGSIVFSSWLTLSFKLVEKFGINTFQAIVFNYITCVITGSFVNGAFPINKDVMGEEWFRWAMLMGTVFISLFNVIAKTAQTMGVAVASVGNKLSLVIPFLFSIYLYNEEATILKIAGVIAALIAVVLTCWPSAGHTEPSGKVVKPAYFLLPVILFFASGLLDTMIKYVETTYINETNQNAYLISAFAAAASIGIISLVFLFATGRIKLEPKAVVAGIIIGVPNYFSIWCLMGVLKAFAGNSSAIIPINNMGIVLFSTVAAYLMFKEKLTRLNWMGIVLSIAAIALIAYG